MPTAMVIIGTLFACGLFLCLFTAESVYRYRKAQHMDHALKDADPMPFGKYRGKRMDEVPASYLHWLWVNERDPLRNKVATDAVAAYIHNSRLSLAAEYPDGIWT